MLVTALCRRLRIDAPIVQAPIGSAVSPELVATVSGADGLGMLAVTWLSEGGVRERIRQQWKRTVRPVSPRPDSADGHRADPRTAPHEKGHS